MFTRLLAYLIRDGAARAVLLRSPGKLRRPRQVPVHHATGRNVMPHDIVIVACSAEGAALRYRTICVEGAHLLGPHTHPEVSMHTPSLAEYMRRA